MATTYTHTTYAQFKTLLATRLRDDGRVFWTDQELGVYIVESLRTWSLMSQFYKDRGEFDTTAGTQYYDLSADLGSLRSRTVTDIDLLTAIRFHLQESTTQTEQFTTAGILTALEKRRNQFLLATGAVQRVSEVPAGSPPVSTYDLPDTVIDVRRLAWKTLGGEYSVLRRQDALALSAYAPTWTYTPASRPDSYVKASQLNLRLDLAPPAGDEGSLHMTTVDTGLTLDGAGVVLGIPDDMAWILKRGALADLYETNGPKALSEYCETRWSEGLSLVGMSGSVWQTSVNARPVQMCSVEELDSFQPGWQGAQGTPSTGALASLDLLALSPVPSGVFSVLVDTVVNVPVPTTSLDYVQVARENLDAVLGYSVHLARLKQGEVELSASMGYYKDLLQSAMLHNARISAQAQNFTVLRSRSSREEERRPSSEEGGSTDGGVHSK